jgi:serine/threonine protein kinase
LLTGELPFEPAAMAETLRAHLENRPADLRDHLGPWPPALPRLLRRLLARHPANRPGGAELIRELMALEISSMRSIAA